MRIAMTLVSVICFIVFTLITAECRWMVGYTALSLFFTYIVMPLFFLILQNIIPLVALAVIGALFFFGIKIFASSGGGGGSLPSTSGSSSGGGSWSSSYNEKKVNTGKLSERGEKKHETKKEEKVMSKVDELNEKYEREFKRITGESPAWLDWKIIKDGPKLDAVKELRRRMEQEAKDCGVYGQTKWF